MPVSRWLMPLTFWWISTSWFVSIAEGLVGKNNHLIFGPLIFCEHDRQLACCDGAVITLYREYYGQYYWFSSLFEYAGSEMKRAGRQFLT
ncbi:Uncharacterised protein [Enterobacter hormaechei]|nr:Uncharacterised protein [Enterobacter hormaechei]